MSFEVAQSLSQSCLERMIVAAPSYKERHATPFKQASGGLALDRLLSGFRTVDLGPCTSNIGPPTLNLVGSRNEEQNGLTQNKPTTKPLARMWVLARVCVATVIFVLSIFSRLPYHAMSMIIKYSLAIVGADTVVFTNYVLLYIHLLKLASFPQAASSVSRQMRLNLILMKTTQKRLRARPPPSKKRKNKKCTNRILRKHKGTKSNAANGRVKALLRGAPGSGHFGNFSSLSPQKRPRDSGHRVILPEDQRKH